MKSNTMKIAEVDFEYIKASFKAHSYINILISLEFKFNTLMLLEIFK